MKITDIYYSVTDNTLYVTQNQSKYYCIYNSESIEKTSQLLSKDGWNYDGKLAKWEMEMVDMWFRDKEIIAVWEEKINK